LQNTKLIMGRKWKCG